jgi:hypothetical protein
LQREQFLNPAAEYRIHPFWFWNGEMDDHEMERQIEEMNDKGVGGFFICPRQGLQIPYLSDAWFSKVKAAVNAAKERGMHVWLYDEYPYPSGIAGGEVTLIHPDAKQKHLVFTEERVAAGSKLVKELPWANILSALAVPVSESGERDWSGAIDIKSAIGNWQADPVFQKTGLTAYNQKRFFTYRTVYRLDWEAPAGNGQWDVVVYQAKEIDDFKYYGTFVDPCNKEAMATFIKLTHDRYKEHFGEEFGKTVKGMFTDEIGLLGRPWTPKLEAYFQERNGYSIIGHLPALTDASYKDAARIRYDYFQALHELLTDSYHKQVYDWCEENGLQYVAEVPSIRMTTQRYSHVPGGDSSHEKLGRSLEWILDRYATSFRDNPKMMSSIARQLSRERNLDECFHSVGWSMNLQDARWMIDRMAAMGINMFTFHAFFYTVDGLTQHDAPPSQFYQNPYWSHFRQLGDYTGRISYIMSQGSADIRIAMVDPTTTLWTHLSNPLHHFDYDGHDPVEKQKVDQFKSGWGGLRKHLLQSGYDYDHLDAELLAEAQIEDSKLIIGKAAYSMLLLPPMSNLEQQAWETIKRFLQAGGTAIAYGSLPVDRIESGSTVPEEAAETFGLNGPQGTAVTAKGDLAAYFIPYQDGGLQAALEKLDQLLERLASRPVTLDCGPGSRSFLMQCRYVSDTEYVVFASNQEGASREGRFILDVAEVWSDAAEAPVAAELLDLETGSVARLEAERSEQHVSVTLPIAPYSSRMIRFTRSAAGVETLPAQSAQPVQELTVDAEGPWKLKALAPNALRLEHFTLAIGGMDSGQGIPVQAKTFIDQCADAAEQVKLPVTFSQIFGTPKKLNLTYPIPCSYKVRFFVEKLPETCQLLMDRSAVLGEWTLKLNGASYTRECFAAEMVYDNANILCDVRSSLTGGWNELVVEVLVQHDWDGVVDALYLYGDFGVQFDADGFPVVTEQPSAADTLEMARYYSGYPYYAGTWSFTRTLGFSGTPDAERFTLSFNNWKIHDTAEVLLNGQSLGVRPWSPYLWEGEAALLRQGENELEVRITGTLIGLLEGKYFDYEEHRVIPVPDERSHY